MRKIPRFDFKNINLLPKRCIVQSRNECDTSFRLGEKQFKMPVIPANMECVINENLAMKLAQHDYFYILHRFNVNTVDFSMKMRNAKLPVSISLGVNKDSYNVLYQLKQHNLVPDYVTIDIAHGHSVKMEKMIDWIRATFPLQRPFIIAGNVSTKEAVRDLENWGADAIKVGIGPGSACTTYMTTGFGSRGIQASVLYECVCAKEQSKTHIIADGGIEEPGDIAKALVLGADSVMIGGMVSGMSDSPGNVALGKNGKYYKEVWGSASPRSGKINRIEGKSYSIPMKDYSILTELKYIQECLQSSISYGGGKSISDLYDVEFTLS